jgi:dipeptidyl aminopeptidase/acylaminoacyl peptidase
MGRKFSQLPAFYRLAIEFAAIYVFVVTVVFFFQRHMEYFPFDGRLASPKEAGVPEMSDVHVKTADGLDLLAWFAPPKKKDGPVVVIFHGNAGNLAMRSDKARILIDHGYGVFLSEYRGFSGNPGSPSEQGFYDDGRAAINWL